LVIAAVAMAVCALAAAAPHAFGGPGFYITLHNSLNSAPVPAPVKMVAARSGSCWYNEDLGRHKPASPGQSVKLFTEKNNAFFSGCNGADAARRIDLQINESANLFSTPLGLPGDYRIYFQPDERAPTFGFNFYDSLTTWVPRADGHGLVCWNTYTKTPRLNRNSTTGYADIWVLGDARCNRAMPAVIRPDSRWYCGGPLLGCPGGWEDRAAADHPGPRLTARTSAGGIQEIAAERDSPQSNAPVIVDLLSTVGVACDWYAYPGNKRYCDSLNVAKKENWSIDNLSQDVADFKVTDTTLTEEDLPVGNQVLSIPKDGKAGTLRVAKTITTSTDTNTTTTHGTSAGIQIAFEQTSSIGMKGIAEGGFKSSQQLSAGYNFSTATAKNTHQQAEVVTEITANAAPGFVTRLEVRTRKVTGNYAYKGDVEFGKRGVLQPVATPATQALGMSPARRHPCLAYVVGDTTVRNSIMNIGKALTDAGNKENEPTLAPERRAFLRGVPGFTTASQTCPGFPPGFASEAAFKGEGVGTYNNEGFGIDGKRSQAMIGCVYVSPVRTGGSSRTPRTLGRAPGALAVDDPCERFPDGKGKVTKVAPGNLSDGSARGRGASSGVGAEAAGMLIKARGARTRGTPISDEVIGDDGDEQISVGSGTFEQVYARGGDDLVSGGLGEDVIYGGQGADGLDGGGGSDTLHGGGGSDRLKERGGGGTLSGDGGGDTLIASGSHRLTMLGGEGDDRLFSRDKSASTDTSASTLGGGPGDDRYVVTARGKTNVFEMPGDGDDVLRVNRRVLVPTDIERAVATGGRPVELRSADGRQTLVGNRAANVLAAGLGSDRVRGGRGGDRILLNEFGFDTVTGGGGADSFVPRGTPANADRPAALEDPRHRTAHRLTGFHPGRGDRIVMLASVFGKGLLEHHGEPAIVRDHNPRPRHDHATILFDDRTGLVSFDRDGTGPISDKVAVVLPDGKILKRSWLKIRG
jgi:Ca2+-binding RTX toxin-like protein